MSGAFNAHRQRRKPKVNITSLIDVMFLLLIFFMVSSTFRENFGIDVALPAAASADSQEMGATEIVVTREGAFYWGQQRVDAQGLRASLQTLVSEQDDPAVVLRADEKANFGAVIEAIDIARDVGGTRLIIPTKYGDSARQSAAPARE